MPPTSTCSRTGVYRLIKAVGLSEESIRFIAEHPHAARPRRRSSAASGSTAAPSRSPTCSPIRTTARTTSSGWRASAPPWARRCCSTTRSSGRSLVWRNDVSPFDEREMAIVTAFAGQAAMAVNGVKLVQELEARSAELAKKVERAGGAARGRRGRQLQPRRRPRAVHDRHARRRALRDRRRLDHGVLRARPVLPGPQRLPDRRRAWSSVCARIRIDLDETLVGRAAQERPADRGHRPRARSTSTPTCRSSTTPAGARWSPSRCCARTRSSVSLIVRRKRTGDFTEETVDLLETFAEPVGARPAERPAVPRAEGAERRARARQPAQVGVPGEHVARAPDAAQRRPRLLRGAAGADVRRDQRAPGGVPPRHPRVGQAPAGAAQRDPRPVQGRGRPDGAGVLVVRAARRCSTTRRRCCASGPPLHGIDLRVEVGDGRRRGVRRRAAPQAGPAQPGDQRGQVHRRRRRRSRSARPRSRAGDPTSP